MTREMPIYHMWMLVAIAILTTCNIARFALNAIFIHDIDKALDALKHDRHGTPLNIPLRTEDSVMVFEPTKLYGVQDVMQWESLTPGSGWVKEYSGEDPHPYAVSMYHQLHCLNFMRYDLKQSKKGVNATKAVLGHANHCYNFLRQALLCSGDCTLEPHIAPQLTCDNPEVAPDVPHVCRDWTRIREYVGTNYHTNIDYIRSTVTSE